MRVLSSALVSLTLLASAAAARALPLQRDGRHASAPAGPPASPRLASPQDEALERRVPRAVTSASDRAARSVEAAGDAGGEAWTPPRAAPAASSGTGGAGGGLDGSGGLPNEVQVLGEGAPGESLLLGSGRCSVSSPAERSSGAPWLFGAALAWILRRRGRHA